MRRILPILFVLLAGLSARPAMADVTVDFEDLGLPPGSFNNNTGGFVSRGAGFNNVFVPDPAFPYWSGWSPSSMTDATTPGFGNQYSAIAGGGAGGSATYGVAFVGFPEDPYIDLPDGLNPVSAEVTNTTYAALSMESGDSFAKKFGGASGNDPDFFRLTITGYAGLKATGAAVGSVDFYLADFRFADHGRDYIVTDWTSVDLRGLAGARSLAFALASSDNSDFGGVTFMNTPSYFALDNLRLRPRGAVPEPSALLLAALGLLGAAARGRRARPA